MSMFSARMKLKTALGISHTAEDCDRAERRLDYRAARAELPWYVRMFMPRNSDGFVRNGYVDEHGEYHHERDETKRFR